MLKLKYHCDDCIVNTVLQKDCISSMVGLMHYLDRPCFGSLLSCHTRLRITLLKFGVWLKQIYMLPWYYKSLTASELRNVCVWLLKTFSPQSEGRSYR